MEPRNRFRQPMAAQYDNPILTRFLAPIDCSKITAQKCVMWTMTSMCTCKMGGFLPKKRHIIDYSKKKNLSY